MRDAEFLTLALQRGHRSTVCLTQHGRPLEVLTLGPTDASRIGRTSVEQVCAVMSGALDSFDGLEVPMQRYSLDPALTPLGPWRPPGWMRTLGVVSELSRDQRTPPTALVSRTHAVCGDFGLGITAVLSESTSPHEYGWSSVATDGTQVIKTEVCSTEYLERAQVPGEARFLERNASARHHLRLPELRALSVGQGVNAMIRDHVAGEPVDGASARGGSTLAFDLLGLQIRWASVGLCHNDLRPWNLLATQNGARLVDFADAGTLDSDVDRLAQTIALAGLLAWLLGMPFASGPGFAGEVRAAAEAVIGRELAATDPYAFPWDARVIAPWATLLNLPAHEAFEAMVLSASKHWQMP